MSVFVNEITVYVNHRMFAMTEKKHTFICSSRLEVMLLFESSNVCSLII